ncbi:uncharacterized protein BDZ99DRAFT_566927 [Mytilinidion resinicola]|uniref:Uncharacterized protein n=1 Tax=Mytilinidion resinicola TaxID=574789 RepID=A0A6A6Z439_9PEZI|nr:uncharacterized protein BDZ99DRAFT_566927 [Mytilinidion resinicola]KAF2815017.1 hypothetical protein BDZ99DRAFT_566927 [Mytilinidion resinicola]
MSSPNPNPTLLPSPFPDEPSSKSRSSSPRPPHDAAAAPEPAADEPPYPETDDPPYIEPTSTTLLPPPSFSPFFTLIEDAATGEHYHPSLHYLFADDDPILLTAASMRALGVDEAALLVDEAALLADDPHQHQHQRHEPVEDADDEMRESPLPPPLPGVTERYLVVDVGADGQAVADAQSLSAEWQVTQTAVRAAPSWDEEAGGEGLMLVVGGVEVKQAGKRAGGPGEARLAEARGATGGDVVAGLERIVGLFDGELGVLRRVVGETGVERPGAERRES